MPPNGHALLSASSSDRWLHCLPSARPCELYEDKGSNYAAEDTDAHTLCEYNLRKALGMEATAPTANLTWFNQEMDDCAAGYAAYILELLETAKETCADPLVLIIEQRLDFSRWVEDGFSTSDAILIADGTMHVIDYKHGLGILVSAVENPQMFGYNIDSGPVQVVDLTSGEHIPKDALAAPEDEYSALQADFPDWRGEYINCLSRYMVANDRHCESVRCASQMARRR